jgi:hypothetical protein
MYLHAEAFWLPKAGSTEAEYEDAFAPPTLKKAKDFAVSPIRFAVADGATEALFSRQWAIQLVRAFANGVLGYCLTDDDLNPLRQRWSRSIHRRELPWYAEEKAEQGAFSSLLGLELFEKESSSGTLLCWRAVAVGDTCLFHVAHGRLSNAWPIHDATEFGNNPTLICSKPINERSQDRTAIKFVEGVCGQDSAFYLMTDALSCWFLREQEHGNEPWQILADLGTNSSVSFPELVTGLRSQRRVKNDDVTLLRVDVLG